MDHNEFEPLPEDEEPWFVKPPVFLVQKSMEPGKWCRRPFFVYNINIVSDEMDEKCLSWLGRTYFHWMK